jgi:hypothetical protein
LCGSENKQRLFHYADLHLRALHCNVALQSAAMSANMCTVIQVNLALWDVLMEGLLHLYLRAC